MRTSIEIDKADRVLQLARTAVSAKIQLLEALSSISEILGCSFETVHDWVTAMSITADSGMELKDLDLIDLVEAASEGFNTVARHGKPV